MARRTAFRGAAVVAALVVGSLTVEAVPALAQSAEVVRTERIAEGLRLQTLEVRLDDGALARGRLLRWREGNASLKLRPLLAQNTIAGLETTPSMSGRALRRGAIAGVNGGYFVPRPTASPNGPFVAAGRLQSGPAVGASGSALQQGRGTIGITGEGRVLLDRLRSEVTATLPHGMDVIPVDDVNRTARCLAGAPVTCPAGGELILYDDAIGTAVPLPAGTTVAVLDAPRLPSSGSIEARVAAVGVRAGSSTLSVPDRTLVLAAYGEDRGPRASALRAGDTVRLDVALRPAGAPDTTWTGLVGAVPGAPLLLRDGERQPALYASATTREDREALGTSHRLGRHPRTALGRTPTGALLMVTIDGRRPGWSSGVTLLELTALLESLGATDAVNLDGGGPTTMTAHGSVVNRPSEVGRGSPNGLFLHAPQRRWHLSNRKSAGPAAFSATLGFSRDQVLSCDWNGNGTDTPGTFANGRWVLSNRPDGGGRLRTFTYGRAGDTALCGDFNGDGRDTIGVHRGRRWLLRNANSAGVVHYDYRYGRATDTPLVGDWNANGRDTAGVRRGRRWLLRDTVTRGNATYDYRYGRATDTPLVGDWNANGRDTAGVRRGNRLLLRNGVRSGRVTYDYRYGRADDLVVAGDFNGSGRVSVGVIR